MVIALAISPVVAEAQIFTKASPQVISFEPEASRSVNWIDYDNDNDLDLFITTGLQQGDDNLLYRNDNGIFTRVLGQPLVNDNLPSDGSSWGDFNNDGQTDLCVVNWYNRPALLYRNDGAGSFTFLQNNPVSNQTGYSETCTWGDYDNNGFIDLFITNSAGSNHRNYLYKNTGGNFLRVDTGAIALNPGRSRGANWIDIDRDNDLDLFVCRESGQNEYLYINNGGGIFSQITNSPLTTLGGETWTASWGDFDNDGDADVFIGNHLNQVSALFRNDGDLNFTRITEGPPVTESGYAACSGWGDYDNDGDLDLFVTQAYVPPSFSQKLVNRLYRNMLIESGSPSFQKITAGEIVNDSGYSYGFAWGDFDNDGDLDAAVANTFGESQKNVLYINENSNGNSFASFVCTGTLSNRSAIGARVELKSVINGVSVTQMRQVEGQSGYCGQNLTLNFGLGNSVIIDSLIITWPAGSVQRFSGLAVNKTYRLTEGGSPVSASFGQVSTPGTFVLKQNYPNPFNPVTMIEFSLESGSFVKLSVFDLTGKEIAVLKQGYAPAGSHSVRFDATNMPSGMYFYSLLSENGSEREYEAKVMGLIK